MSTLTLPKTPKSKTSPTRHAVSGARARVQAQVRAANQTATPTPETRPERPRFKGDEQNTNTADPKYARNRGNPRSQAPQEQAEQKGFYGTGTPYAVNAQRRVEQKQAKLARQTGNAPYEPRSTNRPSPSNHAGTKPWQASSTHAAAPSRQAVTQDDVHAPQTFFASCPRGLEWALVTELEAMDINVTQRVASGALIQATWSQIATANVTSRIASRFLWQLSAYTVRGEEDIYSQVGRIPWEKFFNWRDTIKVDTVGIRAEVRSLEFVTLRVKDAICDRFRAIDGNRPSVDTAQPSMRIMCVLDGLFSQIYLDTSGEPLFKRGWRQGFDSKGEAALKENLAAGLLALTQWQANTPLYDPMCGSGTLIIEAAQRAYGLAPGQQRAQDKQFAMQKFWHVRLPASDYHNAQSASNTAPLLFASDINPDMVAIAAHNIQAAGLPGESVQLAAMDVLEITPPCEMPGIMVLNPPYGERMSFANDLDADTFYDAFAANLKRNFKGWSVWLLTSDETVQARMRLKPNATHHVFNGALPCRWLKFDIS